ncbi:DUF4385 domain-containing protein [Paludisphaera soli]|uniref:DUF4385 domain-containing protein n=1 Tax=Paludisphaera soli TaxID=2712865 RepID=UPI0013EA7425|nr:DUF4385 domain-containing protein [Paludisphaera soli]
MPKPRESFDHDSYPWKPGVDYRETPEAYRVGKGEQGVLICEPYKSEIVAHWRFKTPDEARESSRAITTMFRDYLDRGDFVGADMARKFLQMGYTRARRYANYRGGRKYDKGDGHPLERGTGDPIKAESAAVFHEAWKAAEADPDYAARKTSWKRERG